MTDDEQWPEMVWFWIWNLTFLNSFLFGIAFWYVLEKLANYL